MKGFSQEIEPRILNALRGSETGMYIQEIAAELSITRHTASKYLEVLKARGMIDYRQVGNVKVWQITTTDTKSIEARGLEGGTMERRSTSTAVLEPAERFAELYPVYTDEQAVVEASKCLECGGPYAPAPCVEACPAQIDIPKFIQEIRLGDPEASARTIFSANILGGSCARVCPVEELCEGVCVLKEEGRRPVAIGRLQRYATDWVLSRGIPYISPIPTRKRKESVGVIGAGPAGLSCAAELAQRGYRVTVYDAYPDFGGLITYGIAPYRQWYDPIPQEVERIQELGVRFEMNTRIGVEIPIEELERRHEAIFLGIGLGEDIDVRYPGDELEGVYYSLEFIEMLKQGEWDKLKVGRRVAVIGGGNTAIDVARESVRLGAQEVIILYRRTNKEMPAYRHEVEEARDEGVHFYWLTNPVKFIGDRRVQAVECIHMKLGTPDRSGRPRPEPVEGTEFVLEIDTVIKAIGQRRRTKFLESIANVELESGLIKIDPETGQMTNPRYFAGGDCINGGATVVEAVRHGKIAAWGIDRWLNEA
ncbi:MAG: FAD-dependent oxidoreductase [Candidatus Bipolaricaulia bacterium]